MKTKAVIVSITLCGLALLYTPASLSQDPHGPMMPPHTGAKKPAVTVTQAKEVAVNIKNLEFGPKSLRVKIGTKVTWTNQEGVPHTVNADNGSFESGNLTNGQSFSYTFDKPGTYRYYCTFHGGKGGSGMEGVVKVTKK